MMGGAYAVTFISEPTNLCVKSQLNAYFFLAQVVAVGAASRGSGAAKVTIDYLASPTGAGSTVLFPKSAGRLSLSQAAAQLQADSIPEGTDAAAESRRIEATASALAARGVIGSLAAIVDAVIAVEQFYDCGHLRQWSSFTIPRRSGRSRYLRR